MVTPLLALIVVGLVLVLAGDRWRIPVAIDVGAVLVVAAVMAIPVSILMYPGA